MKKLIAVAVAICSLFCTFALTGCGSTGTGSTEYETVTVYISGSSSVSPLMAKLGDAFLATEPLVVVKENGKDVVKKVELSLTTSDSGQGVSDVISGTSEIGMASREIKSEEIEQGAVGEVLCYDGIVLITHKENAESNITQQQLYDLYYNGTAIGTIQKAITRESSSGTRGAFDELVFKPLDADFASKSFAADVVSEANSTGLVTEKIVNDVEKNTIGYISLGSLDDSVKALTYEGIEGTVENIMNDTYKLYRPFNLVFKDGVELSPAAQKFMDFINSEEGQAIISDGYIPLEK